jgi:hypothetical protein
MSCRQTLRDRWRYGFSWGDTLRKEKRRGAFSSTRAPRLFEGGELSGFLCCGGLNLLYNYFAFALCICCTGAS